MHVFEILPNFEKKSRVRRMMDQINGICIWCGKNEGFSGNGDFGV